MRIAGIDKCVAALQGRSPFTDPDFAESAARLRDLVEAGGIDADLALGSDYVEAQSQFQLGKSPMWYMGVWAVGDITNQQKAPTVYDKVVAKKFPVIRGKGNENAWFGGSPDAYWVSSKTKHPEEAVKFIEFLLGPEGRQIMIRNHHPPLVSAEADDIDKVPVALRQMLD